MTEQLARNGGLMEHCNICDTDVDDVDAHVRTDEHLANLRRIQTMFNSKVYQNDKGTLNI